MNILLIEDDKTTLKALKFALSQKGNRIIPASNEANALRQMKQNPIDLIISDVNLPGTLINELIFKLRSLVAGKGTPVILISSEPNNTLIDQTLLAGADAFIPKPVNFEILFGVLERLDPLRVLPGPNNNFFEAQQNAG